MPQTLRKACHACTKAKRRCVPQLPSCDRCAKKQIPCLYDLEPVSQAGLQSTGQQDFGWRRTRSGIESASASNDLEIVYNSVISAKDASINAVADGHSTDSPAAQPRMTAVPELVNWLIDFLAQAARDGQSPANGTPFVHHHLLLLAPTYPGQRESSLKDNYFRRLSDIHERITQCLQLLILHKPGGKPDSDCETLVTDTFQTIQTLWSMPLPEFDESFDAWEAWLTAESIRRSMFIAVVVRGLFIAGRSGYIRYEPFFESCPFDPRAGLWEARSSEKWYAIISERHGGVQGSLKSYHEFITGSIPPASGPSLRLNRDEDGAFQRLLFVMYNGVPGIQYLQDLDKQAKDT